MKCRHLKKRYFLTVNQFVKNKCVFRKIMMTYRYLYALVRHFYSVNYRISIPVYSDLCPTQKTFQWHTVVLLAVG